MYKNIVCLGLSLFVVLGVVTEVRAAKKKSPVWTDTKAENIPQDYGFQGEFAGKSIGCQVISLGGGKLHAVVYPGGLPGDGWDGKSKILMDGTIGDGKAAFSAATGNRKYLAGSASEFSATTKFPPEGNEQCSGISDGRTLKIETDTGASFNLKRIVRESDTLGMRPPKGAITLFDGSNKDGWNGGRLDEKTKLLNTDGRDIRTKQKFTNYLVHIEFMLPYRPDARGQGRGNSGVYSVDMYELQVLDSFGLEGFNNECGGIYKVADPRVNMCFPPLTWQTFDIEFTSAVVENGRKVRNARMTVRHNGVVIHDDQELPGKTGGAAKSPEGSPGSIRMQGHGNPLQYRNIWIVEN
ncbi:MAG: DUF1080 domain-containing protein [Kiritimatiellia bacterium]|nr:DUF1080 domain-containing protein [Kiritimatiellia bacterium]